MEIIFFLASTAFISKNNFLLFRIRATVCAIVYRLMISVNSKSEFPTAHNLCLRTFLWKFLSSFCHSIYTVLHRFGVSWEWNFSVALNDSKQFSFFVLKFFDPLQNIRKGNSLKFFSLWAFCSTLKRAAKRNRRDDDKWESEKVEELMGKQFLIVRKWSLISRMPLTVVSGQFWPEAGCFIITFIEFHLK